MTIKNFPPSSEFAANAHVDSDRYDAMYAASRADPEAFWAEHGKRIDWMKPFSKVKNVSYAHPNISIKWFEDGTLNVSSNCIDRHLAARRRQTAIIWEGDNPEESKHISYGELHEQVCKLANVYKSLGVEKGDRVVLYMPMIPEAAYAMLACNRIGAVHSIVFAGFSPEALASRVDDCGAALLVTADEAPRGGKNTPLKANVDKALEICGNVQVLMVERTGGAVQMVSNRDHSYKNLMSKASSECIPEEMSAEDPLFILYTSGSTGKPKGVLHTSGGYLVWAAMTHELVFDYHEGDIYWCTADVGWITGHSYIVYGPLLCGATTVMFEGIPTFPNVSRFWDIVDKYKINQFYTAPTAIRALQAHGLDPIKNNSLESLKVIGSVGEPINEEAWHWYHDNIGKGNCPLVDTWWQTETGGIMISALAGITPNKPAHASLPLPGIHPVIVDADGNELIGNNVQGNLCIKFPWPSILRTTYGDHQRCINTYFSNYKGMYFTGDGVKRDHDGYLRILGRVDDVINVSGHRMGTAEVENAINEHEEVIESAVVGYPHNIKGEGIYAYVIVNSESSDDIIKGEIIDVVRKVIGPIAKPDKVQIVSGLPKTRSGKIMRRILRKIASNDYKNLGDTSTLLNPNVVEEIIKGAN